MLNNRIFYTRCYYELLITFIYFQGYRGDKMDTYPSRQSLGSILSGESRGSRYVGAGYCQTATYRGSMVRYKELYFNDGKCKNMSR